MPLYILELVNSEKGKEIYNLNRLLYTLVSVEPYRPRSGLKQCFRCQKFNHTFAGCKVTPQCVICAGGHSHKDCPNKIEARNYPTKLKCANYKETGHPASYRGCASFKKALENYEKPKNRVPENTPKPRSFNSKKVTEGFSYSSALTNQNLTPTPAQNRSNAATSRTQPNPGNSCNMEQMLQNISPMLNSVENPMEKFMLLSRLFEVCFSRNG